MPWDELRDLIKYLPRDAAVILELEGDRVRWGDSEHLLAAIYDVLQASRWQFATAHASKGRKPKQPRPYPRPGVVDPTRKRMGTARMTLDQARRWMASRRKGR